MRHSHAPRSARAGRQGTVLPTGCLGWAGQDGETADTHRAERQREGLPGEGTAWPGGLDVAEPERGGRGETAME